MRNTLKLFSAFLLVIFISCEEDCDCQTVTNQEPTTSNGSLLFWTNHVAEHGGFIRIIINGSERVTNYPYNAPPPYCLSNQGCAYFYLPEGTYTYTTIDNFGFTATGSVTVIGGQCNKKYFE